MINTDEIIDSLISHINNELSLSETCVAVKAFETEKLPVPLKKSYLSLTPHSNKVTLFKDENQEYCEVNEVVIRMNCFTPLSESSLINHNIAHEVLNYLSDLYMGEIIDFSVGETLCDRNMRAYKVGCLITFRYESCAAEGTENEEFLEQKNFFCKTHVTDTDMHLSGADRDYLSQPFATGSYEGEGGSYTKEIVVGFPPSFVLVFRKTAHAVYYENNILSCYTGFATHQGGSKGLSLNSTGFSVVYSESNELGGSETRLNDEGVTYVYVAFR